MNQRNSTGAQTGDCATCRFHSASKRNKVADVAFDEIVEWTDEIETVYTCTNSQSPYAGKEVGVQPVRCFAFSPAPIDKATTLSKVDALMARFEERHKNKDKEERHR